MNSDEAGAAYQADGSLQDEEALDGVEKANENENDAPPADKRASPRDSPGAKPRRVLVLGATGTIGRATTRALIARGHEVVCFVRESSVERAYHLPPDAVVRMGDVMDPTSVDAEGFRGHHFEAVVSCMASRSGAPADAWAVDHQAHLNVLRAAEEHGVKHFVLLSAICVQKPRLAFQKAKLAFEEALHASSLRWSIVRPTAYFKSLSGQLGRVQAGKPFLVFGDGKLTPCKPIGDDDLGAYLVGCLEDQERWNRVLPIGGPGPALTPLDHGEPLFAATGREPRFRHVPVALLDTIVAVLSALGRVIPPLKEKSELARIGRYYATESMLVWDDEVGRYDADATPEFGTETLGEYYEKLVRGEMKDERGEHAVF
jgi:divinyl chlorophyllide a 8-vinyl-reductase